ncbi:hypothetical protein SAMN05216343_10158 [Oscillibacter sp. PC13]|uniref:hypothetical protein n=1 Tax=Oscillibacter sp. PC13 TaxID=1855299 RepID=UPI0008E0BF7E|nr:hypothetical protein [Oscillibacter sp. PC13]SFO94039.1 hypothetical protein SAMN05216343_10158 [Oscillibacter sp. PC13]
MSKRKHEKTVVGSRTSRGKKEVSGRKYSTDNSKVIWCFDNLDTAGAFAFDLARIDFNHREVLQKIISYSNMTWSEVKRQTHDNGKSKHHFLDIESLSSDATCRIRAKRLEERSDSIFSFALQNKLRIIGYREDEKFHAVWFDPQHEFCPSHKG